MKPIKVQVGVTEVLALELHKDVFFKNGFKFEKVDDDTQTFLLKSLPISKSVTFNEDDFHELLGLVMEHLDLDRQETRLSEKL